MTRKTLEAMTRPAVVPTKGTGQPGPAMAALPTDRQRKFVRALCETGGQNHTLAARKAGYTGNEITLNNTAHRLAHDPLILAALKEEADRRIRSGALLGASVLMEIAGDTMHKDRFRAAQELLNRSGLQVITEHKVTVDRGGNEKAMIERIASMAAQLGIDHKKLLGGFVEGEFEEVPALSAPEPLPSTDGLEDIL